ncbi:MAG: response regulator transcription factor [Selenomonadaceae bacterium]|nr:response regulator transcription factor [Selenomonadaceae bacterium]
MKIAIVDDEEKELIEAKRHLKRHIAKHFPDEVENLFIETFESAEEFLKNFKAKEYDLLVFDICLKKMNGVEAARAVRKVDEDVALVFLTSSRDFLLDGYGVFAAGYFLKPLTEHEDDFRKTFAHIFPKLKNRRKELNLRVDGTSFSAPYDSIFFIDIDWRHRVRLHTADKNFAVSVSYENIQKELLTDQRFLECHHRILVNMDKIDSMGKDEFTLTNGDKVPISQRKQKESKAAYMSYLVRK